MSFREHFDLVSQPLSGSPRGHQNPMVKTHHIKVSLGFKNGALHNYQKLFHIFSSYHAYSQQMISEEKMAGDHHLLQKDSLLWNFNLFSNSCFYSIAL